MPVHNSKNAHKGLDYTEKKTKLDLWLWDLCPSTCVRTSTRLVLSKVEGACTELAEVGQATKKMNNEIEQ